MLRDAVPVEAAGRRFRPSNAVAEGTVIISINEA
jgi:hypothetical protein